MRTLWIAVLAVGAMAALPASASASDLSVTGTAIDYDAGSGETNTLVVTVAGDNYTFTDAVGVTITPSGTECIGGQGPGIAALCTLPGATAVDVTLGDIADTVDTTALPSGVAATLRGEDWGWGLHGGAYRWVQAMAD